MSGLDLDCRLMSPVGSMLHGSFLRFCLPDLLFESDPAFPLPSPLPGHSSDQSHGMQNEHNDESDKQWGRFRQRSRWKCWLRSGRREEDGEKEVDGGPSEKAKGGYGQFLDILKM